MRYPVRAGIPRVVNGCGQTADDFIDVRHVNGHFLCPARITMGGFALVLDSFQDYYIFDAGNLKKQRYLLLYLIFGSIAYPAERKEPNRTLKIESIVFDFDGTLAELHLDFTDMKLRLNSLAEQHGFSAPPSPFLPVLEWVEWLEEKIGEANPSCSVDFRERGMELIAEMEMESARKGSLFPFTRPLLESLLRKGINIGIITRNCDAAVRLVFPDILDFCSAFLARDHVPDPKPNPAHLFRALAHIHAVPETSIMVGDHPLDIQTGKAAGVRTAGVLTGSASREELSRSGADWVAENCKELATLLVDAGVLA